MLVINPDNADSGGNGTRIWRAKLSGLAASFAVTSKSHSPFKFIQSLRTICGRGYSGSTLSGRTSLAQRVISGEGAGFQASAKTKRQMHKTSSAERIFIRPDRISETIARGKTRHGRRTIFPP